jgi:hypothetical protein
VRRVAFQDRQETIDDKTASVGTEGIEAFGHIPCSGVNELGHAVDVKELTGEIGSEVVLAVNIDDGTNVGSKYVDDSCRGLVSL